MIDLAEQGGDMDCYVRLKDIAERQRISRDYLVQLAIGLKNANLIRSAPGVGGGYALTRAPGEVSVLDVVEASIGRVNIVDCLGEESCCTHTETCSARIIWKIANDKLVESFRGVTLEDIHTMRNLSV